MAAAEYYNTSSALPQAAPHHSPYQQSPHHSPYQQSPHQSPYQQSPHSRPQELHGSPVPQYALHQGMQQPQGTPPPPYHQPVQQDQKPQVHFAASPIPPQQHRPSISSSGRPSFSSSGRPSFSNGTPPKHGQYLQPPSHLGPRPVNSSNGRPLAAAQPPHMRPYMQGNSSEYSLGGGYTSDPEEKRRRRHRRRNSRDSRDDESSSRDLGSSRPTKNRSRSTNADGFLGAAGGGLIGDLIFPGLGTVGGAVAGWLGGKDYGKHRKGREYKLDRDQKHWERKFGDRSPSSDGRHGHDHHHHDAHRKSPPRHRHDY